MRRKPHVWVVGDSMLDISVRAEQFPRTPEDRTVPVLPAYDLEAHEVQPGGAANVAANLSAMGCDTILYSRFGRDKASTRLIGDLDAAYGVDFGLVKEHRDGHATVKTRYYEDDRLIARHDSNFDQPPISHQFKDDEPSPDAVVLTDYGRGVIDEQSLRSWVSACRDRGVPLFGDPKLGRTAMWRSHPGVIMVANFKEARELVADPGKGLCFGRDDAMRMAMKLALDFPRCVVKCGPFGSAYCDLDGFGRTPAYGPLAVFDVQGAGDTYLAGLVTAMCGGASLELACNFASAAAGAAVGVRGTAVIDRKTVLDTIRKSIVEPTGACAYDDAIASARIRRMYGHSIGLVNGCFDLLLPHPGHLALISEAAKKCDYLYVGIDSDRRVAVLKGDGRPRTPEQDRLAAVAALRGVDTAFIFDTPIEKVVSDLKPDVIVKGSDYRDKGVPEAVLLDEWSGRLEFVELVPTKSTTLRIAEIDGE